MLQILDQSGSLAGDAPFDLDEAKRLYEAMVTARTYDRKASAMQRQGRLATYAQFEGQEAAQIGSAAALRSDDWMVGTYRDAAAMWFHGFGWRNLILGRTGDERGGRAPADIAVLPPSITVGAHMLHAVGLGWAEKHRGSDKVALTYFGDGATSEGDFHEAMNFAAVFSTPTIFLCQNNGFAISMPRGSQTVSGTLADKAGGYGMPGLVVDGNDVMAVSSATSEAVERARSGQGPTFIEAVTYRMAPHTTTDDASRYRTDTEVEEWRAKDPISRVQAYLEANGGWDQAWQDEIEKTASETIEAAVVEAEGLEPFGPSEIFDAMFAEPTSALLEQRDSLTGSDS